MLRKYFIMGSQNCDRDPLYILKEAAEAGITSFQFREKGADSLSGKEKLQFGKLLRDICREYNIPFIVNDDIDLVELLDADGIHVGQEDMSPESLRKRFPDKWIGLSISNKKELANSPLEVINYIGAGPVYPTATKDDAKQAVGTEWISYLKSEYPQIPVVGIGGITIENAQAVLDAGADGVAVISAIAKAGSIKHAVKHL